jgi:serine/threonine protein kinase
MKSIDRFMTPERLQQIRRLFESVVDLAPEQRTSILRGAKSSDPELTAEVEALVSAYQRRDGFIEQPVTSVRVLDPLEDSVPDLAGTAVGPYRLLQRIGEGGMGEVWLAEQTFPVRRRVAVKLIKAGMDTREVVARFESERQALALMDHPAIAKVFDAGSTPEGRPYFAMEYVAGVPITTYCDEHKLTLRERLKLFIRVCEGVQHAHQKAIIHRDVKPSNILVTEVDGKPAPKIIDFGVARAMSQPTSETFFTRIGAILGTPDYMSPEQAYSKGEDIDTRADVYSLGVVLYELLVGSLPFDFRRLALAEVIHILSEADAPCPSARLRALNGQSTISTNRRTDPATLMRQVRGDLDAIALKALEKDRSRRYGAPSELADDIGRYLRSEPVAARPASAGYQVRKYIRRHFAAVAAASLLVALLASFGIVQAVQLRRITRERDRADRITNLMTSMFKVSNPNEGLGNKITAREILDKASKDVETGLTKEPELQAQMMEVMGRVYYNLGLYSQAESLLGQTLRIRRRILGSGRPQTAQSMMLLANTLSGEGHNAEAETLYREALAIWRRVYGPDHPETLKSMHNLAVALAGESRFVEAETLHRQVLDTRRRLLGREHPDTLSAMDSLGVALDREGRYGEAEILERETLEIGRRTLGPEHPQTQRSLHHLANTLYDEGRYVETEALDREALKTRERVLGPEHRDTLNAMIALGDTLDNQGRYAEAKRLDRTALDSQRRILGPEHPDTLLAMTNLAGILADEGQYGEAEKLHREALAIRRRTLGPEHADTLRSMSKLAAILLLKGSLGEAETLARSARESQLRILGPEHPHTAETTYNLACIAAQRARSDEALSLLRNAVDHGLKPGATLRIEKDPGLNPLREDSRFNALAAYARRHAAAATRPR